MAKVLAAERFELCIEQRRIQLDGARKFEVPLLDALRRRIAGCGIARVLDEQVRNARQRADHHDRVARRAVVDEPHGIAEVLRHADRRAAEFHDDHTRSRNGSATQRAPGLGAHDIAMRRKKRGPREVSLWAPRSAQPLATAPPAPPPASAGP